VVWVLLTLNIFVFAIEVMFGLLQRSPEWQMLVYRFGARPVVIVDAVFGSGQGFLAAVLTLFSSMFVHGSITHIGMNMLFLYIFADNIEDEIGHVPFLGFYLLCGLAGALLHILFNLRSPAPMIGASGAISGVLGAYIIMFPRARVLTLVVFFIITMIEIPAYWFLAIWFGLQIFGGLGALVGGGSGTAFWAHVGGFLMGVLLARIWLRYRPRRQRIVWWQ